MIVSLPVRNIRTWIASLLVAAILVGFVGLITFGSGMASAAPGGTPVVGAGTHVANVNDIGACTVTAVDKTDHEALFAGHCGNPGSVIVDISTLRPIGTIERVDVVFNGLTPDRVDWGVVKLYSNVILRNIVPLTGVASPEVGSAVSKYGHGIWTAGKRSGVIEQVTPTGFLMTTEMSPMDSGSPVYDAQKRLVGIASGTTALTGGKSVAVRIDDTIRRMGITPMLG